MNIYFLVALFSHLMADFTLQTSRIAAKKAESYFGVLVHCLIVFGACLACMLPFGLIGIVYAAGIGVLHFVTDCHKLFYSKKYNPNPLEHFYFDQILHILALIALLYLFRISTLPVPAVYALPCADTMLRTLSIVIVLFGSNTIATALIEQIIKKEPPVFAFRSRMKNGFCGALFFLAMLLIGSGIAGTWAGTALLLAASWLTLRLDRENRRLGNIKLIFHIVWAAALVLLFVIW